MQGSLLCTQLFRSNPPEASPQAAVIMNVSHMGSGHPTDWSCIPLHRVSGALVAQRRAISGAGEPDAIRLSRSRVTPKSLRTAVPSAAQRGPSTGLGLTGN